MQGGGSPSTASQARCKPRLAGRYLVGPHGPVCAAFIKHRDLVAEKMVAHGVGFRVVEVDRAELPDPERRIQRSSYRFSFVEGSLHEGAIAPQFACIAGVLAAVDPAGWRVVVPVVHHTRPVLGVDGKITTVPLPSR